MMSSKVAVVTGANKGVGYEIAKQLLQKGVFVILTARDEKLGMQAIENLGNKGVEFHQLDITDDKSIQTLATFLADKYKGLDILVNNAGIAFKGDAFDAHVAKTTLATNYFGTSKVAHALIPLVRPGGRVVNVSSVVGLPSKLSPSLRQQFIDPNLSLNTLDSLMNKFVDDVAAKTWEKEGWPTSTYAVSKIGCTALTRILARENASKGILINACCPGYVQTDMSSWNPKAGKAEDGATIPVWLATLPEDSKWQGGFFRSIGTITDWENFKLQ